MDVEPWDADCLLATRGRRRRGRRRKLEGRGGGLEGPGGTSNEPQLGASLPDKHYLSNSPVMAIPGPDGLAAQSTNRPAPSEPLFLQIEQLSVSSSHTARAHRVQLGVSERFLAGADVPWPDELAGRNR